MTAIARSTRALKVQAWTAIWLGCTVLTIGCSEELKLPERESRGERKSKPVNPTKAVGSVTLNGQPLASGIVTFHEVADAFARSGDVVDGKYHVADLRPGKYRVTMENRVLREGFARTLEEDPHRQRRQDPNFQFLEAVQLKEAEAEKDPKIAAMLRDDVDRFKKVKELPRTLPPISELYENPETTNLSAVIEVGRNELNFNLLIRAQPGEK